MKGCEDRTDSEFEYSLQENEHLAAITKPSRRSVTTGSIWQGPLKLREKTTIFYDFSHVYNSTYGGHCEHRNIRTAALCMTSPKPIAACD